MRRSETKLIVQETDLDIFGHVNNAVYLRYFENARWEYVTQMGLSLDQIIQTQIGPVILEVLIKYQKELKAREEIRILSEYFPFQGKIGKIRQTLLNGAGKSCCEADFTYAVFDMSRRKIIPPPDLWLKATGSSN